MAQDPDTMKDTNDRDEQRERGKEEGPWYGNVICLA